MGDDWTPGIGLRNATLSLLWRSAVALALWVGAMWVFDAILNGIGMTDVPRLIAVLFAAAAGTVVGLVMSRGLDETAGFVSPLLTFIALVFTALVVFGGASIFASIGPEYGAQLRFIKVGGTRIIAGGWIVKYTLVET